MSNSVQLTESCGSVSWISMRAARRLIRDRLAVPVSHRPLRLVGAATVARMWSSRYVKGRDPALRLMRDELRAAILRSKTGEPPNSESEEHRACRLLKDEKHIRTAHGWGRE